MKLTPELRSEYVVLFNACQPHLSDWGLVDRIAAAVGAQQARYAAVSAVAGLIPWQWIGVVHLMESAQSFRRHLHNGDPLTSRTVRVPAGRPAEGAPPFAWEASAADALRYHGLDRGGRLWTLPEMLFEFERWNGFGYRTRGVPSPYLWAGSQIYEKGKFVADGRFDPEAVSKQEGAAVVLKRVMQFAPVRAVTS